MQRIAITGNIASGKSTAELFFKEKGFSVLDTDKIAHKLLKGEKIKNIILKEFEGSDIKDGEEISRPKLGKIVFNDEKSKEKLEQILHPLIKEEINIFFKNCLKNGEKAAFCAIPLLFETGFETLFDSIILIYSNDDLRLERLIKRDGLSKENAQIRLQSQISQDEKIDRSDFLIYNNESKEKLIENLRILSEKFI